MLIKINCIEKKDIIKECLYEVPLLNVDCGEIILSDKDSCRLMVINAMKYVENPFTDLVRFNFDLFNEHVKIAERLMDDLIDLEGEKIKLIIDKIRHDDPEPFKIKENEIDIWEKIEESLYKGRRTGLGLTAIGDTLALLDIPYGSEECFPVIDSIYKSLRDNAYLSSVEMARDLGPFPVYNFDAEIGNPFIESLYNDNPGLRELTKQYGRRNIALLTSAPVGSVSILTRTTSGIEPVFRTSYTRRKKVNTSIDSFDFIDQNGIKFSEHKVYHAQLKKYLDGDSNRTEETSPWFKSTSDKIDWIGRVNVQSIAQKYIDHSISSTINLPNDVSLDTVSEIYMTAWKSGCKGMTIYRDGSRSGILISNDSCNTNLNSSFTKKNDGIKRDKEMDAEVQHFKIKGNEYYVTIGFLENQPYEIFVGMNDIPDDHSGIKYNIPKSIKRGKILKVKRGNYKLKTENGDYTLSGIVDNEEVETVTRLISLSLRHKIALSHVVQQLEKISGFDNFPKVLARALKKYIINGTKVTGETCPSCGSENLVRENGCITCADCSWTRC